MSSMARFESRATIAAAVAAAGGVWTWEVLTEIAQNPAYLKAVGNLPEIERVYTAGAVAGLFWSAADYLAAGAQGLARRVWPEKVADPENTRYRMPKPPGQTGFYLILGEDHGTLKKGYAAKPGWFVLPALGLHTGVFVVGPPGSGKTAGVLRPALRQVFDYRPGDAAEKPAGLVMDYKASLVPPVREEAERVGRTQDLLLIGPAHPETKWNPLHAPEAEARVLAGRIMAVLENMSGQSGKGDTAWIADNAARLAEHSINLIREATGYVTMQDLHELISGLSSALDNAESADVAPADAAAAFLAPYEQLFQTRKADGTQYNHSRKYLIQEFAGIESRYRQIYTNELQRVTQYFVDPKYAAIYSPREEEITYPGGAEAIDRGLISILDATVDKYGSLAKILGIFLKLDFMRAAIARPQRRRDDPNYNFSRLLLWMCDEYQEFATTGDQGDDSFYAVCRESKVFSIVATQSKASIERLLGEDKTKVLLASLRTKVFLALSDPADAKWASEVCGDDWQYVENASINESVSGAVATAKTGYVGKETTVSQSYSLNHQKVNRFEPVNFRDLPAFAAIVSGFDGAAAIPPALVYLKPYFRPTTETYKNFREASR